MFGLVNADISALSENDKKIYQAYYCGLCRCLKNNFGTFGQMTLNFDMTFLVLFLSSYFDGKENTEEFRCGIHPFKKKNSVISEFSEYGAKMNILLTYYKLSDDIKDDNSKKAAFFRRFLKKENVSLAQKEEKICFYLEQLEMIEKRDEHNPDIPANCFGNIMGEIFDVYNNDKMLFDFGFALGKVIYIMDACIDLKEDIKKCRYNPMVEISSADFQQILTILLCDCTDIYDKMNIIKNKTVIDNILFSGIWSQFRRRFK